MSVGLNQLNLNTSVRLHSGSGGQKQMSALVTIDNIIAPKANNRHQTATLYIRQSVCTVSKEVEEGHIFAV